MAPTTRRQQQIRNPDRIGRETTPSSSVLSTPPSSINHQPKSLTSNIADGNHDIASDPLDIQSESDADHSDYAPSITASKKRKAKHDLESSVEHRKFWRYHKSYGQPPETPSLRNDIQERLPALDSHDDETSWAKTAGGGQGMELGNSASADRADTTTQTFSFDVTNTYGKQMQIVVNLGDLVNHPAVAKFVTCPTEATEAAIRRSQTPVDITSTICVQNNHNQDVKSVAGFLDLPVELRDRIYRLLMVSKNPIDFHTRQNLSHTAALIRTCKKIQEEATTVLYGSNAFHFKRQTDYRGRYFDPSWFEVGYEDARRFFEDIGQSNVSKIKYVSFAFTDGPETHRPGYKMPTNQGKFVSDPTLQQIFRLLSNDTILERFGVLFAGRGGVYGRHYHFLQAISRIKCHQLDILKELHLHNGRVSRDIGFKLKELMEVPREDSDKIDQNKKKFKVNLAYEESNISKPEKRSAWDSWY